MDIHYRIFPLSRSLEYFYDSWQNKMKWMQLPGITTYLQGIQLFINLKMFVPGHQQDKPAPCPSVDQIPISPAFPASFPCAGQGLSVSSGFLRSSQLLL